MKFLSQEEIKELQVAEAQSNKKPKKTAEQIQAIYSSGQNILVSASAGSGKTFVMAERILDQLARGVEIRQEDLVEILVDSVFIQEFILFNTKSVFYIRINLKTRIDIMENYHHSVWFFLFFIAAYTSARATADLGNA